MRTSTYCTPTRQDEWPHTLALWIGVSNTAGLAAVVMVSFFSYPLFSPLLLFVNPGQPGQSHGPRDRVPISKQWVQYENGQPQICRLHPGLMVQKESANVSGFVHEIMCHCICKVPTLFPVVGIKEVFLTNYLLGTKCREG